MLKLELTLLTTSEAQQMGAAQRLVGQSGRRLAAGLCLSWLTTCSQSNLLLTLAAIFELDTS
jgi:hypothetical protein